MKWMMSMTMALAMTFACTVPGYAQSGREALVERVKELEKSERELQRANASLAKENDELRAELTKIKGEPAEVANPSGEKPKVDGWRGVKWGSSQKTFRKKFKKAKPVKGDADSLSLNDKVGNDKAQTFCEFKNGGLVRVVSVLSEQHLMNDNAHIKDFERLKEALTKKYGEPDKDLRNWTDDLYQDQEGNWGTALALGHLVLIASWELEGTQVVLIASSQDRRPMVAIQYTDTSKSADLEAEREKELLDDL